MIPLLKTWVSINSQTDNLKGQELMRRALIEAFLPLGGHVEELPFSRAAPALLISMRPNAEKQILLVGHMDTALPSGAVREEGDRLFASGSVDMKGGLVVLLETLRRFEASKSKERLGWQVLITSDEEIGSPNSSTLFPAIASKHTRCLIFEPTLPDGALVSHRKGSANFTATAQGKSAHAGRDFFQGDNSIQKLARYLVEIDKLSDKTTEVTVNVGKIWGGEGANTVPDRAGAKINVRAWQELDETIGALRHLADIHDIELQEDTFRPAKPLNAKNKQLFALVEKAHGKPLKLAPSGGVCDGNNFSALGLSVVDTMGPTGGGLHTPEEYVLLSSLEEKVALSLKVLDLCCYNT